MLARLLAHLRGQWVGALALFLVLTGGAAYAAHTVFRSDIVDNQGSAADVRNDTLTGGGLRRADLRTDSVRAAESVSGGGRGPEVEDQSLTGVDINDGTLGSVDIADG